MRLVSNTISIVKSNSKKIARKCLDFSNATQNLFLRIEQLENIFFKDVPDSAEKSNIQFFERLYNISGGLKSTAKLSYESKLMSEVYFHHREKSEIALTAGSSWYGGDYFEFGSHDLSTFRNMLSAYDICAMTNNYKDVRFYAFDIFGDPQVNAKKDNGKKSQEDLTQYFGPYTINGDQIKLHEEYLDHHNLFRDKCFLVQGLFENTLTQEFKTNYKHEGRKIGFAFLDCNIGSSYKTVFEYIFDLMAENSYIYMDEYIQNPDVIQYYSQFIKELAEKRNIGSVYIRNAGGFGALFRLYPLADEKKLLNLKIT